MSSSAAGRTLSAKPTSILLPRVVAAYGVGGHVIGDAHKNADASRPVHADLVTKIREPEARGLRACRTAAGLRCDDAPSPFAKLFCAQ